MLSEQKDDKLSLLVFAGYPHGRSSCLSLSSSFPFRGGECVKQMRVIFQSHLKSGRGRPSQN